MERTLPVEKETWQVLNNGRIVEIVLLPYRETIEDVGNGYNSLKFKKVLKIKDCFFKTF